MTKYYFRILKTEADTYRPMYSVDNLNWERVRYNDEDALFKWTAQWACYRWLKRRRYYDSLSKWSVIEEWVDES